MTRPLRRNVEEGWYHVFGRGLERRAIFTEDADRRHLYELLAELHERYRVVIHAYVLMENHYHAILRTPEANLSRGMQWFHGSYAAWYNARHDRVGPLFQGRYRAIPVEDGGWAYELSLYVHLNPLRIAALGLDKHGRILEGKGYRTPTREQVGQRLRELRAYRWSSYRAYAGYEPAPEFLETQTILERADRDPSKRHRQYRKALGERLSRGVDPGRIERLRDAVAIGSAEFAKRIRALAAAGGLEGISGKRQIRRRLPPDEVKARVAQIKGEPWEAFAGRRGDPGRPLFLWAARRLCGMTLREIGAEAGGMKFSAVGAAIKRLERAASTDPQLRRLMSGIAGGEKTGD